MFNTIKTIGAVAAATMLTLGLASCEKETARGLMPENPVAGEQGKTVEIRGAVVVVDEEGNEIPASILRANGTDIGTWTGLGTFPTGHKATVTYALNSGAGAAYTITSMANATPQTNGTVASGGKSSTVSFTVSAGSIVTVKVKKLGNVTSKDVVTGTVGVLQSDGKQSGTITLNYSTTQPNVDYSGKVIPGSENNNTKTNQTPSKVEATSNQTWLTVTPSSDKKSVTVKPASNLTATSIEGSKGTRTATVTIKVTGVDGKVITKTVTVTQYNGYVPTKPGTGEWKLGDGKVPGDVTHSFGIKAETWNFGTSNPELKNTSVKFALYENGVKADFSRWIAKIGVWSYTEPASAWASFVSPTSYKAADNADNKTRSDKAYGKLTVDGYLLPSAASASYTMMFTLNQTITGGVVIDGKVE